MDLEIGQGTTHRGEEKSINYPLQPNTVNVARFSSMRTDFSSLAR